MRAFAIVLSTAALAADVVPHCGGPTVVIQNPGQDCGAHGSRWRGDCRAPTTCEYVSTGTEMGSRSMCTIACSGDAECEKLAPGFTCSGTTSGELVRKVCAPPERR